MKPVHLRVKYLVVVACELAALRAGAKADTFVVDVSDDKFTIYTDPNSGVQVKYGGFSGLFPVPGDRDGKLFYAVTDRGPGVDFGDGAALVLPHAYSPTITTVRLHPGGTARIRRVLPLRKPNGEPLTGIGNPCVGHEDPIVDLSQGDLTGSLDPDALDPEGITVDRSGNFWLCEEFRPSIFMAAPDGRVLLRLVPRGMICGGERIPTFDMLPRVYGKRVTNKGLEGIAARHGRLFAILQRPLVNPDSATSKASRIHRILELDLEKLLKGEDRDEAVRQFLYVAEANQAQDKVLLSDLFNVTRKIFVVPERGTKKAFAISLSGATDITKLENEDGFLRKDPTRTIEQLSPEELGSFGIRPVRKVAIVADLTALDPALAKCEGMAVVDKTLFLCPDNDFNLDGAKADFTTMPATLALQVPSNLPRIITTPLPRIEFPGEKDRDDGDQGDHGGQDEDED